MLSCEALPLCDRKYLKSDSVILVTASASPIPLHFPRLHCYLFRRSGDAPASL